VEACKPAASRQASAEIFVVCQGYKAPGKIDPRLLDGRVLFNEVRPPCLPAWRRHPGSRGTVFGGVRPCVE
jgi:hypothetical protein